MKLAIVSEQRAFTHWKVAVDIFEALKGKADCTLYDWGAQKIQEPNILFVSTILSTSLHYLTRFLPNKRVVFYTTLEGEPIVDPIGRRIAEQIKIVAVSEFAKEMLERVELDCEGVVYHGIKMRETHIDPRFQNFLNTIQHPPNEPQRRKTKYLTVSSNMKRKGLEYLIIAHKLVEFYNKEAILILHSGGGYTDVARLADQLQLTFERFWFTNSFGMYDSFQMNTLYQFVQFLVQPSLTEGFGLPMIEALNFRLPVIAINAGPYNEIIEDGKTGILIPVRALKREKFLNRIILLMRYYSINDLAEAITQLLNTKNRKRLARNITDKVRMRFDSQKTYPRLLRYFE